MVKEENISCFKSPLFSFIIERSSEMSTVKTYFGVDGIFYEQQRRLKLMLSPSYNKIGQKIDMGDVAR